jgi:hypothetical protein
MKKVISAAILCLLLVSCGPPQDGHGTHEFDDGVKYVGEWKDGRSHGQGTMTWADGRKYVGEWKDGWEWAGTYYDKDGNVIATSSEGIEKPVN